MDEQVPAAGATQIDTEELLAAIGELYIQARVMRRMIAQQQQAQQAQNGQLKERIGSLE